MEGVTDEEIAGRREGWRDWRRDGGREEDRGREG